MPATTAKPVFTPGQVYHKSDIAMVIQGQQDEIHIIALQQCAISLKDEKVFKEGQVRMLPGEIHTLHWDPLYDGQTEYKLTSAAGTVETGRHQIPPIT